MLTKSSGIGTVLPEDDYLNYSFLDLSLPSNLPEMFSFGIRGTSLGLFGAFPEGFY